MTYHTSEQWHTRYFHLLFTGMNALYNSIPARYCLWCMSDWTWFTVHKLMTICCFSEWINNYGKYFFPLCSLYIIFSCKMYQPIYLTSYKCTCIEIYKLKITQAKLNTSTFFLMYWCFIHILRIHTDIVSTSKCKMNCLFEHKQCSRAFCLFEFNTTMASSSCGFFQVWCKLRGFQTESEKIVENENDNGNKDDNADNGDDKRRDLPTEGCDAYRLGPIDLEVKLTSQRINSYLTVQL